MLNKRVKFSQKILKKNNSGGKGLKYSYSINKRGDIAVTYFAQIRGTLSNKYEAVDPN